MSQNNRTAEYRATARIDQETKKRLEKIAKSLGVTTSDLIRMGINAFLPQIESGKLNLRHLKAA